MDTALIAEQFDVSRRHIQQLAKGYRETGKIPTLEQRGRSTYAEYPAQSRGTHSGSRRET